MKLPNLDMTIDGSCRKDGKWFYMPIKLKRGGFDWKNDPFDLADWDTSHDKRTVCDFNEVKDFSFQPTLVYNTLSLPLTKFDDEPVSHIERVYRDLMLMLEQVECYLKEYNSPDSLEKMCKGVIDSLVHYSIRFFDKMDMDNEHFARDLAHVAIDFSCNYQQFMRPVSDFRDWCYMKFSFLFKEEDDLKDYYDLIRSYIAVKPYMVEIEDAQVDVDSRIDEAKQKLEFLNGWYKDERLMSEGNFNQLMRWLYVLIRERRIENDVAPIELRKRADTKRKWNKQFVVRALSEAHDVFYKRGKNKLWMEFVAKVTGQDVDTVNSKFRTRPEKYDEVVRVVVNGDE